jgi:hypothetical protein
MQTYSQSAAVDVNGMHNETRDDDAVGEKFMFYVLTFNARFLIARCFSTDGYAR